MTKDRVTELIASIKDKNTEVALAAIEQLGETGDDRAVDPLIDVLGISDHFRRDGWRLRIAAAKALKLLRSVRAVAPLSNSLMRPGVEETNVAIEAIAELGPEAIESLIEAMKKLERKRAEEPKAYAAVFVRIGQPAVEPLEEVIADTDANWLAGFIAKIALEEIKSRDS